MSQAQKNFISLVIIIFCGLALFQQYGFREDYPFSYFGMYKASHRPQPYSKVEIELYLDDKRFNFIKKIDPYQVKDFIRKTYLGEKITRNQMSLSEHDEMLEANINSETDLMMKEFIHTYVIPKLSKQIYSHLRVVITYKNWTLLSYESHKTPDIQKVLFDENFVK